MSKLRVYELARELKKDSKTLIKELQNMGINIASHQNVLSEDQVLKIRKINSSSEKTDTQIKKKVVVRRRKKVVISKEEDASLESSSQLTIKDSNDIQKVLDTPSPKNLEDKSLDNNEKLNETLSINITKESSSKKTVTQSLEKDVSLDSPSEKQEIDSKEDQASLQKKDTSSQDLEQKNLEEDEKASSHTKSSVVASQQSQQRTDSLSKRSFEGGATIVRRATQDEKKKLIEENLNKAKKEDPRSIYFSKSSIKRDDTFSSYNNKTIQETAQAFSTSKSFDKSTKKSIDSIDEDPIFLKKSHLQKKKLKDFSSTVGEADELSEYSRFIPQTLKKRVYSNNTQGRRKRDIKKREPKSTQITTPRASYRIVKMERESIVVFDLAKQLSVKVSDVIKKLMSSGIMATQNQSIDFDTASLIAEEYGYQCKIIAKTEEELLPQDTSSEAQLSTRPPIVTVMGHVDHGKTSILDVIRKTGVADKEAGGITQHIGAYTVKRGESSITFIDTPGHAAFSAMRSRGAKLTDIVILVVAADDGVMPQTVEAISHAKEANVPIIVAINKIDKPNVNFDRIYHELSEHGIQSEEWGGDYQFVKVSALENRGIDELLESIILQAEMQELKGKVQGQANGVVIEAHLEKGRGPVATVVVTGGVLEVGQQVVVGTSYGKVRAMTDHTGKKIKSMTISKPVEIVGLNSVPLAGDVLNVVSEEKVAREIAELRESKLEEKMSSVSSAQSLDDLLGKMKTDTLPKLSIILKTDTQGTAEAIHESLSKLNSAKVIVQVIHKAVGGINESDLNLAETSGAVIFGFNVRMPSSLQDQYEKRGIIIKYFNVIYELIDSTKSLMQGKLPPLLNEVIQGHATVRDTISIPKIGLIAGSSVTDGKITRTSNLRLIRDDVVIYDGKMGSLKRFKDDVKEVQNGYECGIGIEGFHDIKKDDIIEAYMIEEKEAQLDI